MLSPMQKTRCSSYILPIYQRSLDDYLTHCRDRLDLRCSTVASKERILRIFMSFLSSSDVVSPVNISQVEIADFIMTRSTRLKTSTLSGEVGIIRGYYDFCACKARWTAVLHCTCKLFGSPKNIIYHRCGQRTPLIDFLMSLIDKHQLARGTMRCCC